MDKNIKQLNEENQDIVRGLENLLSNAEKEQRGLTDEEKAKYDADFSRKEDNDEKIDLIKRSNELKVKEYKSNDEQEHQHAKQLDKQNLAMRGWFLNHNGAGDKITTAMRQSAYELGVSLDSQNFFQRSGEFVVGTDASGGYSRTPSTYSGLERFVQYYGGILGKANVKSVKNGNPGFFAFNNDSANLGVATAELDTIANVQATFSAVNYAYSKFSSGIFPISNEAVQDTEEDVNSLVVDLIGERLAKVMSVHTTTGNLTNNKGFMTDATNGKTLAGLADITIDELIDLRMSVDWGIQSDPSCSWYMNLTTLGLLMKKVDDVGRPLLMPDYNNASTVMRLFGFPIVICTSMANFGASTKPIAFGAASKYRVNVVNGVQFTKLNELYALQDCTGYIATVRLASRLVNTAAIKYATCAAS